MQFNIPSHLDEADKFIQSPYIIFEFHNFMDNTDYNALVQEIYSLNDYDYTFDGKGGKKGKIYTRSDLKKIKLPQFNKFMTEITNKSFFKWFSQTHLPYFNNGLIRILVSRPRNIFFRILRRINRILNSPLSFYHIQVETSVITKGSSIPPHTDDALKRLSLILYLCEKELPEKMRINLGTIFYGVRNEGQEWSRFDSILLNNNETNKFYKDYQKEYISQFRPNVCAGFIKNDISWHAVSKNIYDYGRKALVINILEL